MTLPEVRDIAVVVLAAVGLVSTLVVVITALLVWRLIAAVRADVAPIIGAARDTVETVQSTVGTVGEMVAQSSRSTPRAIGALRQVFNFIRRLFG